MQILCRETMREIPLTQGKVALVDDADYDWLMQWKWCASETHGVFYAIRHTSRRNPPRKIIFMHRAILGVPGGVLVDHRDFDGLNNQRYNLRQVSIFQSNQNRGMHSTNRTGFKGIYKVKNREKYRAEIVAYGQRYRLGQFNTKEEAAAAYQEAAIEHFGEFREL